MLLLSWTLAALVVYIKRKKKKTNGIVSSELVTLASELMTNLALKPTLAASSDSKK